MKTMHKLVEGSTFNIIENAAHLSNLEQPEKFNSLIAEFIGNHWYTVVLAYQTAIFTPKYKTCLFGRADDLYIFHRLEGDA